MASNIKDIDRGWTKIKSELLRLSDKSVVHVGIQGEQATEEHNGGLTNAQLGTVHEFGTAVNPERSFLRSTVDENRTKYAALMQKVVESIVDRRQTVRSGLALFGERVVADVKRRISSGKITPPLKPETIRRKGSSKPLEDSGQLRNAITYSVEEINRTVGTEVR